MDGKIEMRTITIIGQHEDDGKDSRDRRRYPTRHRSNCDTMKNTRQSVKERRLDKLNYLLLGF